MAGGDMGKRLHVVLQKADSVLVELLTNVGVSQVVALQNLMTELMVASLLKNRLLCTLYGCLTSCATLAYLPVPTSFYGRNTESTCPLLRLSFVQASTKRTFQISVLPEGLFHIKLITFASWLFEKCRITLLGIQWDSGAGATSITLPHPEYLLGTPAYVGECLYEPRGLIVLGTEEK
ncbi:MAG: uncharacterized protein KVP18_002836 [Porospora cf. gigantea A]|uniref:uncharacterized protein n=1 Tax=Porospora cf. gigantea A TaxID=2853593 RepID=UPI0035595922|nr:MAG: hypothetical protein KVP18_002836 [Porospora cf. gigantea A]